MPPWPLLTIRLIIGLFCLTPSLFAAEKQQPPNIVFLFADDQRADTIGALGNPVIQTPHLDKLVQAGLSFHRAYMQGGMNAATCIPSRAMLLSGRSLFRIDETLQRDQTWPEAFAQAGYTTFVTGKWHNGDASIPKCFQLARSMFTGGMANPMQAPLRQLENGKMGKATKAGKHACEIFADEVISFLGTPQKSPFLCYVPFDAPHDPHIVPDDFPIKYDPDKLPLPPNFAPEHPFDNGEMKIRDELLLPFPRTPEMIRSMLADYYRYVSYLDSQIGRILEALAKSPFSKNTIVVFSADSGVARGSHGLIGKQNLYEHSVRVPLIVSGPGIPSNVSTDAMCYLYDVFPTLGAICGVKAPQTSEGVDLSRVLVRPAEGGRPHLRFAYKEVQQAVSDAEWKLIDYPKANKSQLFNLKEDPAETRDLSSLAKHKDRLDYLRTLLAQDR